MKIIAKISLLMVLGTVLLSSCNKQAEEQIEMLKSENQALIERASLDEKKAMEDRIKDVELMRALGARLDSSFVVIDSLQAELQKCKK